MEKRAIPVKSLLRFICYFLGKQRGTFVAIFLLSLVWSLDATLWPYLLRRVIDVFTTHDLTRDRAWPDLKWFVIAGALLWLFVESGFRIRDFMRANAFPKLEADIRMAMFDHIQYHSPKYFNEHFAGTLSNKINDMTTQVTLMIVNVMTFFPTIVACILSIIFFAKVSPLFAVILAIWIITHLTICFAFTPRCMRYSQIHGEARSSLAGKIVDSLTNNFAVNLFCRFTFERARITPYQKEEQEKNHRAGRYTAVMFSWLSAIFILGGFTLNGFMIIYWIRGHISTAEIIQIFNTTWGVIFMMWVSGEMIPQFFQSIGIGSQALSLMQDPQDVIDSPQAVPLVVKRGEIIFDNLSFYYGKRKIFDRKHVHIKGGEKVGLVGYSGAGKSTFVNLILRFHSPAQGRILIDGQDIAHVRLDSLRKQVTLIPQEALLFHRSIEDNISYAAIGASKEEIINAAKMAHCDEFIRKSPEGYGSFVGERGTKLSGGERQRIAIARAILAQSPILILDEATSALDSVTEGYIQDSVEKLMEGRTTLVIAHRLSTLSKMDRILVFDQGKIIEEGSHLDLIAQGGHYAHMWQKQAAGFLPERVV